MSWSHNNLKRGTTRQKFYSTSINSNSNLTDDNKDEFWDANAAASDDVEIKSSELKDINVRLENYINKVVTCFYLFPLLLIFLF